MTSIISKDQMNTPTTMVDMRSSLKRSHDENRVNGRSRNVESSSGSDNSSEYRGRKKGKRDDDRSVHFSDSELYLSGEVTAVTDSLNAVTWDRCEDSIMTKENIGYLMIQEDSIGSVVEMETTSMLPSNSGGGRSKSSACSPSPIQRKVDSYFKKVSSPVGTNIRSSCCNDRCQDCTIRYSRSCSCSCRSSSSSSSSSSTSNNKCLRQCSLKSGNINVSQTTLFRSFACHDTTILQSSSFRVGAAAVVVLSASQSHVHHEKNNLKEEPMAVDDVCTFCEKGITDIVNTQRCTFCVKLACSQCHVTCEICCEVYCVHCSMVNHSKSFGRILCLDCDHAGK